MSTVSVTNSIGRKALRAATHKANVSTEHSGSLRSPEIFYTPPQIIFNGEAYIPAWVSARSGKTTMSVGTQTPVVMKEDAATQVAFVRAEEEIIDFNMTFDEKVVDLPEVLEKEAISFDMTFEKEIVEENNNKVEEVPGLRVRKRVIETRSMYAIGSKAKGKKMQSDFGLKRSPRNAQPPISLFDITFEDDADLDEQKESSKKAQKKATGFRCKRCRNRKPFSNRLILEMHEMFCTK